MKLIVNKLNTLIILLINKLNTLHETLDSFWLPLFASEWIIILALQETTEEQSQSYSLPVLALPPGWGFVKGAGFPGTWLLGDG